jgi:hypothetical protein
MWYPACVNQIYKFRRRENEISKFDLAQSRAVF